MQIICESLKRLKLYNQHNCKIYKALVKTFCLLYLSECTIQLKKYMLVVCCFYSRKAKLMYSFSILYKIKKEGCRIKLMRLT